MSDDIIMLRDVHCVVGDRPKKFWRGNVYSSLFAGWLPTDSFEEYVEPERVPVPNEIIVNYVAPEPEPVVNEIFEPVEVEDDEEAY